MVYEKVAIRIAVHRLASKRDAADMIAEHKYPEAQPLKLGQQGYRWLDRRSLSNDGVTQKRVALLVCSRTAGS